MDELEIIKKQLEQLKRIKESKRIYQKKYIELHREKWNEQQKEYAKRYYEKNKNNPEFMKKKLENTKRSVEKKLKLKGEINEHEQEQEI